MTDSDAVPVDAAPVDFTDLARTALLEVTPESSIGAPVGTVDEGDGVVSVLFANRMPGYPGWRWTVSVAKVGDEDPTVLEVELMPGDGSLVAPEWVPWSERLAEYRAAQDHESDGESDDESDDDDEDDDFDDESDEDSDDEDADYDDADDDEADDESDDDDDFDADEDDLDESDDDDIEGVDVDALAEVDDDDDDASDGDDDAADEAPQPPRRRRAQRVRPVDPDADLVVDELDAGEVDPDFHRS